MKLKTIILFFPMLLLFCTNPKDYNSSNNNCNSTASISFNKKEATEEKHGECIVFDDGDSMLVEGRIVTELVIDSIVSTRKRFNATYLYSGKAVFYLRNYQVFKTINNNEYKKLKEITTAQAVKYNSRQFYFNAKESASSSFPKNSNIAIICSVYSLFSNNKHIGNELIVDSIELVTSQSYMTDTK